MKKLTGFIVCSVFFISSYSQDIGFHTTDIGAEYEFYHFGNIIGLHLAFNAKLHSSIQVRGGYNKYSNKFDESGKGFSGGVGYRYYFKPFPYKLFIGARVDTWSMKVEWFTDSPPYEGETKILLIQPSAEIGYTLLINDQFYITPHGYAGPQIRVHTKGNSYIGLGDGTRWFLGISAGVRL